MDNVNLRGVRKRLMEGEQEGSQDWSVAWLTPRAVSIRGNNRFPAIRQVIQPSATGLGVPVVSQTRESYLTYLAIGPGSKW